MIPSAHQLSLKLMQRCPSCQAGIPSSQVQVIHENDDSLFAHLTCPRCLVSYIAYVVANQQGLLGNAILTDQSYHELMDSLADVKMNEDEVLSIVKLVETNQLLARIRQQSEFIK